jgi:tetratricopeptide (TPR) repeat protein
VTDSLIWAAKRRDLDTLRKGLRKGSGVESVDSQDWTPFLGNSMVHSSHPHISRKAAIVCVLALAIALGFLARGVQAQRSGVGGHFDAGMQSAAAATKPDYSNEPFVEEAASVKIAFQNDGTSTLETYDQIRIQSDAGVQRYSIARFPYESAIQSITIDFIRVRKSDGTVVVTPLEGIQDIPTDITRQAPSYSDLREKQVAVKGLGVGDSIEMQAHWQTTKPLVPGQFWFAFNFEHDNIMLDEKVEISVPKDRAIKYDSTDYQPTKAEVGQRQIFSWTYSQLTSKSADEQKKQKEEQTYFASTGKLPPPDVQISTFQSWEQVGAWYEALQRDRVAPDAAIRAKSAELTKGAADDEAKIRTIYSFVSAQVHYVGVAFGVGRYQPHAASEVLTNQYGDCKDKHTLLASLLAAAGIKAYPVLVNSSHRIDPAVPSPAQFDHVITAVPQGNALVWLDTTPEVAPYGYLLSALRGKNSLPMPDGKPATLELTPAAAPTQALESFDIDATLTDDGTLKGKVVHTINGSDTEVVLRAAFRSISMAQWKDLVQRFSYGGGFAGDVSDVTVSPPEKMDRPLTFSYGYTRKDFPQWSEHRIAVALPPVMILPGDDKPSHPILLGEPKQELRYTSRINLPEGYAARLPAPVDLDEPFAAYHASYSIVKGALQVERTLLVKMHEVPVADFDAFKTFSKAIEDDYDLYISCAKTHVTALSYQDAIWALPYSANPGAAKAYEDARDDYNKHDEMGEISSLKRAVDIDPKFTRAWLWMSQIYFSERKQDEGLAAIRSAIANDPKEPIAYKGLGFALTRAQDFDGAVSTWTKLVQLAPDDPDAPAYLGAALVSAKRYGEAAAALQSAVRLNPKNATLSAQLGTAYLKAGDETNAMSAYKTALELDSSALLLNNIGYELADANKELPLALEYAQKAVQQEEESAGKVTLLDLQNKDLVHTPSLAADWDTLGWVYFRTGKFDEAERYLNAAWVLAQGFDMGDHLAQVYAKEHKNKEAIRTFRLALSTTRDPELKSDISNRLVELGSSAETNLLKFDGGAELSQLRTFTVPGLNLTKGSAEFIVLFESGPNGARVEGVKFVNGSDDIKDAGKLLSATDFKVLLPDTGPEHLVRRGIVYCDPTHHCVSVLYPIASTRSVD